MIHRYTQMAASMPPLAEVVCPVKALVLLIAGNLHTPKRRLTAADSEASLFGVAVPCALI